MESTSESQPGLRKTKVDKQLNVPHGELFLELVIVDQH